MQQRRYRPGDVLDDYCPRERRITDHAIVAMIDDHIKQTRCVVCDAEHEYKDGKVPAQRRKKAPTALFSQVLEGLQGPQPVARAAQPAAPEVDAPDESEPADVPPEAVSAVTAPVVEDIAPALPAMPVMNDDAPADGPREEGPWRRQLIRAALPRPEGQQPAPTRPVPEFTVRQPNTHRGQRHGRRGAGPGQAAHGGNGNHGPMRFGRPGAGQGQGGRRRRGRGGKKNG
jgi:hypothetical protein